MKTNAIGFAVSWLAAVATLAIFDAPAQMTLSIARSGNQSVLSWPTAGSNYVLHCTTNLAAPNRVT